MTGLNSAPNGYGSGPQLKIDFDAQEKMDTERDARLQKEKDEENRKKISEAIQKYGVGHEAWKRLSVKSDGKVYFDDQTVEEWDAAMKKLDEPDKDDYKYGRG